MEQVSILFFEKQTHKQGRGKGTVLYETCNLKICQQYINWTNIVIKSIIKDSTIKIIKN